MSTPNKPSKTVRKPSPRKPAAPKPSTLQLSEPKDFPLGHGEFLLGITSPPRLFKPDGWDTYYFGSAHNLDLNAHPAALGYPTTQKGFFDIVEGMARVICPMCHQSFTTYGHLEGEHLKGPCQKFRDQAQKKISAEWKRSQEQENGGMVVEEKEGEVEMELESEMDLVSEMKLKTEMDEGVIMCDWQEGKFNEDYDEM